MPNQYLHGYVLVSNKECLRCLVRKGAWKHSVNNEEKRKWSRKVNKKNCSTWYFWPNCGSSRTRCRIPCPVFFLFCQTHFLIIGLNKRPQFPHRLLPWHTRHPSGLTSSQWIPNSRHHVLGVRSQDSAED